jgi:hypothetical protein
VNKQEKERAEGHGPVNGLHRDPAPRVKEHAVGGRQAGAYGGAQGHQADHATVEQQEVLDGTGNKLTGGGQGKESENDDDTADGNADDPALVFGDGAASIGASELTATGTTASRSHGSLLV